MPATREKVASTLFSLHASHYEERDQLDPSSGALLGLGRLFSRPGRQLSSHRPIDERAIMSELKCPQKLGRNRLIVSFIRRTRSFVLGGICKKAPFFGKG